MRYAVSGDVFQGTWHNGQASGYGVYTFADDGETVAGNFSNGVSSGHCSVRRANGDRYEGGMEDDEMDGGGTMPVANVSATNKLLPCHMGAHYAAVFFDSMMPGHLVWARILASGLPEISTGLFQ